MCVKLPFHHKMKEQKIQPLKMVIKTMKKQTLKKK